MLEHETWLKIAQEDLKMAKLALPNGLFSPLVYHYQQAAEKTLKGYLAWKKCEIMRTHDLVKLLELCLNFDRDFEKLRSAVITLNPYSTKFRYPSEFEIPDEEDAKAAIKYAQATIRFVVKVFSKRRTDQTSI